ncbi:hypothetical protein WJX77_003424 [Trebouxia sp. C0004]
MIHARYKGREWGWIDAENVTDSLRATLLLLGVEGKETFTHADWSEAWKKESYKLWNIAFAFDEMRTEERGNALAEWTFLNPSIVEHVNEFTQQLQSNTGNQPTRGDPTPRQMG